MPKRRQLTFAQALAEMRSRDPWTAEGGFHWLLPRASEHAQALIEAYGAESNHAMRCWLLELIGHARTDVAFELLAREALSKDEAVRDWAVRGLHMLDTKQARTFLFEHGLKQ